MLNAIAATLDTRASDLSEGANPTALSDLQAAAAERPELGVDPATAEALAGRFPEWSMLLTTLNRTVRDQVSVISALSDRLTHDPFLSENVHAMLSHITAIRSTSGILSDMPDITQPERLRFTRSIHDESLALSATAQALADYLGAAEAGTTTSVTAEEALDFFLNANAYHFDSLDELAQEGAPEEAVAAHISDLLDAASALSGASARALAQAHLTRYAADAAAMPLARFAELGQAEAYDPGRLAAAFAQDLPAVFRRLATLRRPRIEAPRFGLIVVTASGYPLLRQPLPDFALPRHGNACALWPLFQGFSRPGQPMLDRIEHDTGAGFTTLTIAAPRTPPQFGRPADLVASMLFVAERASPFGPETGPPRYVGTSCRICTRSDCTARTETPLLTG